MATVTARQQAIRERKARDARLAACMEAMADERGRVRAALQAGGIAILQTAFGPYRLTGVNADHWYACYPEGSRPDWANQRSFAGCNDYQWAEIMRQLGLARNRLFADVRRV